MALDPINCPHCAAFVSPKRPAPPPEVRTMEDAIEAAYWHFDAERKRTGAERDAFKNWIRVFVSRATRACELCDNGDGHLTHTCPRVPGTP